MTARKHICVARNANGHVVTYGSGFTAKIAEYECRESVRRQYPQDKMIRDGNTFRTVATYEPFTMPKPKFRKGQKVRKIGSSIVLKVLRLPGPSDVYLAGTICTRTVSLALPGIGGGGVWESESEYEDAT